VWNEMVSIFQNLSLLSKKYYFFQNHSNFCFKAKKQIRVTLCQPPIPLCQPPIPHPPPNAKYYLNRSIRSVWTPVFPKLFFPGSILPYSFFPEASNVEGCCWWEKSEGERKNHKERGITLHWTILFVVVIIFVWKIAMKRKLKIFQPWPEN